MDNETFPNLDETVRRKDIDIAIYKIKSYLDARPYATDRNDMLRLIKN